jgi:type I restriction-modification system DNA methylase subunit/restriction endonuclease S subunit
MEKNETNTTENSPLQGEDTIHTLLTALSFEKRLAGDIWSRQFTEASCELEVDCVEGAFLYEKIGITVSSATTANFSQAENFVVFECVCRLLEKGYKPKDIELEPEWKLGHSDKSGRADIWVRTVDKSGKKHSLLIIECKTAGKEFNSAWRDTCEDGAQLFSYFQQEGETKFLCLYASAVINGKITSYYRLIRVEDNDEYLKTLPKSRRGGYKSASNNKELFAVWRDAYQLDFATVGLFEKDIAPYHPGKNKYASDDLRELDHEAMQRKYHEFATILRQHNVSGHDNAFDKLVNLFLAKLVDEKRNAADLRFHWKGIAYDNAYDLQDRLQRLYTTGMKEFLGETVTYIDEKDIRKAFRRFERDPDATKDAILDYFRQLKFYTNNDFAFLDVHNARLFEQNFAILLKIVRMLEDIRLLTDKPNQFLGDLFEGFLDRGVKQSEGQFFTPLPIVRFIVSSLPIQELVRNLPEPPRVIDYACGAGHFLNEYAQQAKPFIADYAPESAREHYGAIVGIEKEYRLSKVAKVAAFMYGEDDMRIVYADALARHPDVPESTFDLLVANPPYSVRGFLATLSEEDRSRYELSETVPTASIGSFNGIETFFVERATQLLKPCGIAAIILPSSILSNGAAAYVRCRDILLRCFDIIAIAEFGTGTFGKTGTNTVTLFLRKKDAPPDFAAHCANRADAWLAAKHDGDDVFQDGAALDRYCAKRGFNSSDYRAFLAAGSGASDDRRATRIENILNHDAFRAIRADFAKRNVKKKWSSEERAAEEMKHLRAEERERLRVFLLADFNPVPVLLIKMPSETKAAKTFLGYEWSARKGNEGIKYLGAGGPPATVADDEDDTIARNRGIEAIQTPLFDNAHLANEEAEKLNFLVRKNFRGTLSAIPETLRSFARTVPLVDLLDFDTATFDRQIRTGVSTPVAAVQSKFPLVRLGDVAEIKKGKAITAAECNPGSVKVVAGGKEFACLHDVANTPPNVITVSASGAYAGFVNFWSEPIWASDCSTIRGASSAETGYLFACLSGMQERLFQLQSGTAQPHVYPKDLANLTIPLPPVAIQQQVVDACAEVDSECAKAGLVVKEGQTHIAVLMEDVHKAKWPRLTVSEMTTELQYGTSEKSLPSGKIAVIRMGNVKEGFIDWSDLVFSNNDDDIAKYLLQPNDVLFNRTNSPEHVGKAGLYRGERPAIFAGYLIRLKYKPEIVNPVFLAHILNSERIRQHGFSVMSRSINQANIGANKLAKYVLPVPPLPEQEKIVAAVEKEEAAISAAKQVLANAADRKRAILSTFGILQEQE